MNISTSPQIGRNSAFPPPMLDMVQTIRSSEENKQTLGKPRYSLLCWDAIEGLVRIREYGCNKYPSKDSWRKVEVQKYVDAAMRHLVAMQRGSFLDEESGLSHADHVMCNMMFVSQLQKEGAANDNH